VQQRAQDEAVQAYLNHIGELLLDKDKPLRQSIEGDKPRTLARARTLTVLRRLDGERKCSVVTFLYEAALISKDHLILNLRHSDLSGVNLAMTNLGGVNLSVALLSEASFFTCNLSGANLRVAAMPEASLLLSNLSEANLPSANLLSAKLPNANLSEADLRGATGLTDDRISTTKSLEGAPCPTARSTRTDSKTESTARMRGRTNKPRLHGTGQRVSP
jgi:uncharacterized protein YjbI with pentapeptide repeats